MKVRCLDIYMPAMNGMEVLARIQQIDPRIPVIMITGRSDIPCCRGR